MDSDPRRGIRIRRGMPEYDEIRRRLDECKANGVAYPSIMVDDLHQYPFGWFGPIPYRLDGDHEMLRLAMTRRREPIALPGDFLIDGAKRLPGETKRQYQKYLAYRDLGPERTYTMLAKRIGVGRGGQMSILAERLRWGERTAAWDMQMQIEAERTAKQIIEDQMRDHIERRQSYLDSEHEAIVKGMTRIHEMLGMPIVANRVVTEIDDEGRATKVTIWEPAKWTYASLSQFMGEIDKIARLHFGLSTSNASQKLDATISDKREAPERTGMDAEMHLYASQKAEEAYFAAIDEWKERHKDAHAVPPLVARVEEAVPS